MQRLVPAGDELAYRILVGQVQLPDADAVRADAGRDVGGGLLARGDPAYPSTTSAPAAASERAVSTPMPAARR
ncbi:hypothetical protein NKG94_20505 [Micromonospora sp. M12]